MTTEISGVGMYNDAVRQWVRVVVLRQRMEGNNNSIIHSFIHSLVGCIVTSEKGERGASEAK